MKLPYHKYELIYHPFILDQKKEIKRETIKANFRLIHMPDIYGANI